MALCHCCGGSGVTARLREYNSRKQQQRPQLANVTVDFSKPRNRIVATIPGDYQRVKQNAQQLLLPALFPVSSLLYTQPAYAIAEETVETIYQFIYLGGLLAFVGGGGYLVIRQILRRRELDYAAKDLQERVRTGQASPSEYYELGAVFARKKYYQLAVKYLRAAIQKWDGDEQDLAQVHNTLGYCFFNDNKLDLAIAQYEKAVKITPGYVIAWNNLGSAYEKQFNWTKALKAYQTTLKFDPNNKVAQDSLKYVQDKAELYKGIPTKFE